MEIIIDGIVYVPKNKEVESVIVEQHFKFEVHPEELGEMTWEDAVKAVKELGSGWRLPTIEECFMYRHKVITTASYWSSSEYGSNYAWYFSSSFYTGYAGINGKTTTYYVRAVKSI